MTMTDAEKREQVAKQLDAVAHLATVLAGVSKDYALMLRAERSPVWDLADMVGNRSAYQMEVLGDMLNNMDAVDDSDEWMTPIFDAAHKLFPQADKAII